MVNPKLWFSPAVATPSAFVGGEELRITYDENGKPTAHLDNANVNDADIEKILYGNARSLDNFSTCELMNELEKRDKKYSGKKFIVRCYGDDYFLEETAKTRKEAKRIMRGMKEENPDAYAHFFKIPFSRRHPNFPLYFSIVCLILIAIR